jgi:hypothetical protein
MKENDCQRTAILSDADHSSASPAHISPTRKRGTRTKLLALAAISRVGWDKLAQVIYVAVRNAALPDAQSEGRKKLLISLRNASEGARRHVPARSHVRPRHAGHLPRAARGVSGVARHGLQSSKPRWPRSSIQKQDLPEAVRQPLRQWRVTRPMPLARCLAWRAANGVPRFPGGRRQ